MKVLYSINIKLWLSVLAAMVLVLFSVGITLHTYYAQLDTLLASSKAILKRELPALKVEIEQEILSNRLDNIQVAINTKMNTDSYQNVSVIAPNGHVIADAFPEQISLHYTQVDKHISASTIQHILASKQTFIDYNDVTHSYYAYAPLQNDQNNLGVLFAKYNVHPEVQSLIDTTLTRSAIVALLILLPLTCIALFAYIFLHKPIQQLIFVGQKLQNLEFDHRVKIKGSGELKMLADSVNSMADNLQEKVAAQKAAEQYALTKHNLLESIFEALPDLFFVVDGEDNIIEFHSGNHADLYVRESQLIGNNLPGLLPRDIAKRFKYAIAEARRNQCLSHIEYPLPINGQTKFFEARLSVMPLSENIVIVVRDITHRKQQEDMIFHHAFFDALTNLPNRFLVMERLTQHIKEATRNNSNIAVMFIDLDDFKKVNDSLGHDAGDKLLIACAKRLQTLLRLEDTVGRLGGDEFVVLLGNIHNLEDVEPIAANLVKKFQTPLKIDNREFCISLSLGIALYPLDGTTPSELLRKADSAMYHSKQQGRNTYSFFTEQMGQDLSRRLELEEHLRKALHQDEFEVYYQPQFCLKTNELIGAEALLRWHNSELGFVPPDEFIPLAESTGEIIEIGKFVLQTATQQAKKWHTLLNKPFKIAVNLSPRQFKDHNLIKDIEIYLEQSNIPASLLELEITEGVLLSGDEDVKDALNNLHQLGLVISMDDFGTGYSSLNYLRQYPFDILKIDQSFVNDLMINGEASELVNSIISMSHTLGIKVVAEGIETLSQLKVLERFRCDIGQGYLLGKPMPYHEFESWVGMASTG